MTEYQLKIKFLKLGALFLAMVTIFCVAGSVPFIPVTVFVIAAILVLSTVAFVCLD
jgi:hypothetical protein